MGTRWGPAVPLDRCGPLWTIVDQSGPATVMAEIVDEGTRWGPEGPPDLDISGPLWTRVDQTGAGRCLR